MRMRVAACAIAVIGVSVSSGCISDDKRLVAVTHPDILATGDEMLVGRPVALNRVGVIGNAAAGGFYIAIGDRHMLVLPERLGITVGRGEVVSLSGVLRRMQPDIASRLEAATANYDVYIFATSLRK